MKKTGTKKMSLTRETLRSLQEEQLTEIHGAATRYNSCDPDSVNVCPTSATRLC
ncbi:MAG: class I lanthipeptide [Thermoanaerobaculia bacterium]